MISVRAAHDEDRESWNAFACAQKAHHSFAWQWQSVLEETFCHRPHYLIAEVDNAIVGIAPLVHVRSMLFGHALISVPYVNAGGILATSPEAFQALLGRTKEIAEELDVRYVELRHRESLAKPDSLQTRSHKVAMHLALKPNTDDLFSTFPAKLRSQIRRPSKAGLTAELGTYQDSTKRALNGFYSVFAENMRDLGTPVYPQRFFSSVLEHFEDAARVITVWENQTPIAAGITLGFGTEVEIPWASSLRKYNKLSPNMLLYWAAIQAACEDGYEIFDFGRSTPDSGTFRFKKQWGAEPVPLHWYYEMRRGSVPDVNPQSGKYAMLVSCWQRLPVRLANLVGPYITRSLP